MLSLESTNGGLMKFAPVPKLALLLAVGLFASQSLVVATPVIGVTIIDPNRFGPPGVVEDFQGTITNDTNYTLQSTDLFFNFSAYDPVQVSLNQILGSTNFSIAPGATSNIVDLFTFALASTAAAPAFYSSDVVLEDVNNDLSAVQSVTVGTGTPEPGYMGLMGAGLLMIGLFRVRKSKQLIVPVAALVIMGARMEAQVSAVQLNT